MPVGEKKRLVVTGAGDPDAPYGKIPPKSRFEEMDAKFIEAPDLEEIIEALISTHESMFGHIAGMEVKALWKAEGGDRNGNATLGKCVKPSGLAKYFGDCDFVIWLAADHLRELNAGDPATALQVEGLCFHELKHCASTDKGAPAIQGHDFEGFADEVLQYGAFRPGVRYMAAAFRQLPLDIDSDSPPARPTNGAKGPVAQAAEDLMDVLSREGHGVEGIESITMSTATKSVKIPKRGKGR